MSAVDTVPQSVSSQPRARSSGEGSSTAAGNGVRVSRYLRLLSWSFTLFNTVRVLVYLPTVWAIYQSGDASQHSLWTWLSWFGANLTTAAWLYEMDGQRLGRVAIASAANAAMCLAISGMIISYRL